MDDFAVLILTHGRPDRQKTVQTLRRFGYTGRLYLVADDEDPTLPQLRSIYGEQVVEFSKADALGLTDTGDNFPHRRGVVYARNECWNIAKALGLRWFLVLDDDYNNFEYRFNGRLEYVTIQSRTTLADMFRAFVAFLASDDRILTVAMSQGGDHIGGGKSSYNSDGVILRRKAMNAFFCATDRPFKFFGRINEDTTAYTLEATRGRLMFTALQAQLKQTPTQAESGGLTELYLDSGTYVKSFYSVMWNPSCVRVSMMGSPEGGRRGHFRLHHLVNWTNAAPKILRESVRRTDG
jgi:hypothetical protein